MDLDLGAKALKNLSQFNVILGKNGAGKSRVLRHFDDHLRRVNPATYLVRYLSPERGGRLIFDAGVQNAMVTDETWERNTRRANRVDNLTIIPLTYGT